MAWIKGHKGIKGNEEADSDKINKEASILGHKSETPNGLRVWAKGVRAEARGGGKGILKWHRRAISAYTWCVTERRGHSGSGSTELGKKTHQGAATGGKHAVEECTKLARLRRIESVEMELWFFFFWFFLFNIRIRPNAMAKWSCGKRATQRNRMMETGFEKEKEKEGEDKLAGFLSDCWGS